MMLNATFNNISVISWRSVLFVEVTGGPRKKPQTCRKSLKTLSHNVVSSTPRHEWVCVIFNYINVYIIFHSF